MEQLFEIIKFIHSKHIVHRDLKVRRRNGVGGGEVKGEWGKEEGWENRLMVG